MEDFVFFLLDGAEEFFRSFPGGRILVAFPGPGLPWEAVRKGSTVGDRVSVSDLYRLFDLPYGRILNVVEGLLPEANPIELTEELDGHRVFVVSEGDMWALADLVWRCL